MKKLLVVGVFLNAALLFALWHEVSAVAQGGEAGPEAQDFQCYDANGDGSLDLGDPVTLLNWLFLGGGTPQQCLAGGGDGLTTEEVALLREVLPHLSVVEFEAIPRTIRFTGVNVQILNGLGKIGSTVEDIDEEGNSESITDPSSVNGLGNLIIGYQDLGEKDQGFRRRNDRTGSHNVVVGSEHNYSSYGGLVVGVRSHIAAPYATITGGSSNSATGHSSSVSGGSGNVANGSGASVSGGFGATAHGRLSSVSGGCHNVASGRFSSVSGGGFNLARGDASSVSGGGGLLREDMIREDGTLPDSPGNIAHGSYSSVSGGSHNKANGHASAVSGGNRVTAWTEGQVLP